MQPNSYANRMQSKLPSSKLTTVIYLQIWFVNYFSYTVESSLIGQQITFDSWLSHVIIRFICLKTQHHKKTFITQNKTGVARLRKLLRLSGYGITAS